ncbi:hypothetical protein [Pedobacter antarcticus]|uniref:Cbb3-type cytochrome oxidase component FixQ n=2 Tax=Pedobacter antarcticus TaxID=34086 RepID=A0A081PJA3_9SPHI|nr:hypothetical protein [Pedobacter antarcticus]KEQ30776.1 hypothetical protein N180_10535 [Pedobacter antarcticus 4BY]SDM42329.1 hypothetical protein SAMN04488084_106226 [Pedobacter antarcticus]SFE92396.1 hypothetical protein SAMN03003324_01826 [Pedobacter antarcticus]
MFKQFLERAEGNQVYLLTSLGIFMLFFLVVGILLLTMKKEEINYMSNLPLNEEEGQNQNNSTDERSYN